MTFLQLLLSTDKTVVSFTCSGLEADQDNHQFWDVDSYQPTVRLLLSPIQKLVPSTLLVHSSLLGALFLLRVQVQKVSSYLLPVLTTVLSFILLLPGTDDLCYGQVWRAMLLDRAFGSPQACFQWCDIGQSAKCRSRFLSGLQTRAWRSPTLDLVIPLSNCLIYLLPV